LATTPSTIGGASLALKENLREKENSTLIPTIKKPPKPSLCSNIIGKIWTSKNAHYGLFIPRDTLK